MKIYEIISLNESELDEGKPVTTWTIRDAKRVLTDLGFHFHRQGKGSHEYWKKPSTGESFALAIHGKELDFGVSKSLNRLMKQHGYEFTYEDIEIE